MREYVVKVRNGFCGETELTALFNLMSEEGFIFDKICSSGSDSIREQRVYIVFYRD